MVDRALRNAWDAKVSDVHWLADQGKLNLRWRIEGRLIEVASLPDGKTTSVLGRIKALARLITYRSDIPQEGRFTLGDPPLEARVGTLPTLHGERAVIRLALPSASDWLPDELGFSPQALQRLLEALKMDSGVVLVTGPAGSGKTTTAYASLRQLVQTPPLRSIVTLEDPIEREIAGTAQSQVNLEKGFDWRMGLRALLRQDPEVMMVGEIRDAQTAQVVFQAAMTGQLVISTMHARSAIDAVQRLRDMDVPKHHILSSLNLLICQRLVPQLCHCLQQPSENGAPCPVCQNTGSDGRLPLVEVLPELDGELSKSVQREEDSAALLNAAKAHGFLTHRELSEAAALEGKIAAVEQLDQ